MQPDDPRHGTSGGYTNHRCRCEACTNAWRVAHAGYMSRHPEQRTKNAERGRSWYSARTPEQRAKDKARERARWARMTPEQREKERARHRDRRARQKPEAA